MGLAEATRVSLLRCLLPHYNTNVPTVIECCLTHEIIQEYLPDTVRTIAFVSL